MNNWAVSLRGLRTVTELEIKQRVRSDRWIWALIGWFFLVGGLTTLIIWSSSRIFSYSEEGELPVAQAGPLAFGLIVYLVLGLGLLIAPAFTATSINGDRAAGTLATLQATKLSAVEIVLGKLLAAWLAAAVFLVVALPFIAWSMMLGSISFWQVLVTFVVLFVEVAVVCAVGLGFSALISRAAGSTMLTYFVVVVLSVITAIVLALSAVLLVRPEPIRVWGLPPAVQAEYENSSGTQKDSDELRPAPVDKCTWFDRTDYLTRIDLMWWVLVGNPFVVVADAAPLPPGAAADLRHYLSRTSDPLAAVRGGVHRLALPPATEKDECSQYYSVLPGYTVDNDDSGNVVVKNAANQVVNVSPVKQQPVNVEVPVWPWGLGFHLLLGGFFFWIAVRKLSLPYGQLARGTRVA